MKKNYPVAWFRFGLLPGFGIVLYRRKIRDCIFWRVCLNLRSIAFLIMGTSPLKIIKHNDDLFWMRGCGPEYLAGLESQFYETQLSET